MIFGVHVCFLIAITNKKYFRYLQESIKTALVLPAFEIQKIWDDVSMILRSEKDESSTLPNNSLELCGDNLPSYIMLVDLG